MYHGCGESSSRRPLRDFARRSERTVLRLLSSMNRAYHRVSVIDPSIKSSTKQKARSIARSAFAVRPARHFYARTGGLSGMKSRPRIFSAIILTPPITGVTSSAASSAPRTTPLRRIVEARTASANAAPTQGSMRVSLIMRTSGATCVPAAISTAAADLPVVEADP